MLEPAQIQQLLDDLKTGKRTAAEVKHIATAALDAEYRQESPQLARINALEDLLWLLHTGEMPALEGVSDRYRTAMNRRMKRKRPVLSVPQWAGKFAAACCMLLVLTAVLSMLPPLEWINGHSTPDEQQYVIQGTRIDLSLIRRSIAAHSASSRLQTDDWDELVDYLGFVPSIPNAETLGMEAVKYVTFIEPDQIFLDVSYYPTVQSEAAILYSVHYFANMANLYCTIEQNATGCVVEINDHDIYTTRNMQNNHFTWIDDYTIYTLSGYIDCNLGHSIITEMTKE